MSTVLVITSTFPAASGDGTPQFVLDLTTRLNTFDRVVVITPRVPGGARIETSQGIVVRRFPYFLQKFEGVAHGATLPNVRANPWRVIELPFLMSRFFLEAVLAVRREKPDLIHAHWVLPSGLIAAMVPFVKVPIVMTAHGVDLHALQHPVIEVLRRFTLRRAATVVPVSGDLLERVADLAPDVPVQTVPMGTDLVEVATKVGPRTPVHGRIGFVGRLADKKGVEVLLRALATQPSLHAVIAGDGPERATLERLVDDLQIGDQVEFLGHATRDQVFEVLRTMEVMVMPSVVGRDGDQEGTPVVLAEACAAGVPVIASRLGGMAELLDEESAWLVPPGDAEALADALGEATSNSAERERRAANARKNVSTKLDIAVTVAAYESIYEALLQ